MSEKAWQALHPGSVPIHLGATNVADILPRGSVINLMDYTAAERSYDMNLVPSAAHAALTTKCGHSRDKSNSCLELQKRWLVASYRWGPCTVVHWNR